MPLSDLVLIAFGLALDAFAVAVGVAASLKKVFFRQYFRLSWHFGVFQALMPIAGWSAGKQIADFVKAWDHWVSFLLLSAIGGKMLFGAGREKDTVSKKDPTRGTTLIVLSLATSLDAFAVGFSLALLGTEIVVPALVIGVVACGMTALGMELGKKVGSFMGFWAEVVGGVVLISIGIKILVDHLTQA